MDIIQACHSGRIFKGLFRDISTWQSWLVFLSAVFGISIDDPKDKKLFKKCTGLKTPQAKTVREVFAICGRRSGKSFISAVIACYLALFHDWSKYLSYGERGSIFIIANDKLQARIIKNYVSGILNSNKLLKAQVEADLKEEVVLKNHITISVKTCNFRTLRGYTILCAILEEISFWRSEDSANPDKEIMAAVRPALATIPESLLIGISTPYSRSGVLWEQFKANWGKPGDTLIWKAPTQLMNPTIEKKVIDSALKEDYSAAKAEWLAEWREDISAFMPAEMIEAVIVPGRFELPKVKDVKYFGFCDPSGGRQDSMTLGISHREKSDNVVLDVIKEVRPPFRPKDVAKEFSEILKSYDVTRIESDRYAGSWVTDEFRDNGISVENSELSASEVYLAAMPIIANGTCELLDNKRLKAQLAGLERKTRAGGKDLITHYPGGHDDVCNAACGALIMATKREGGRLYVSQHDAYGEYEGRESPDDLRDRLKKSFFKDVKYIKPEERKVLKTGDLSVKK